jgi:hypothetical protein
MRLADYWLAQALLALWVAVVTLLHYLHSDPLVMLVFALVKGLRE